MTKNDPVGFDPAELSAKLDALTAQVSVLVERQQRQQELYDEMGPILREVMTTATERLGSLEEAGYFTFGAELLGVIDQVVRGFEAEDVRALGAAVVSILETVRALTQPEVLEVMTDASAVIQKADTVEPVGLLGVVRASRNQDVQQGMAVLLEVLRHVGRGAERLEAKKVTPAKRRRRGLEAATAPRRKRPKGIERPAPSPDVELAEPGARMTRVERPTRAKPAKAPAASGAVGAVVIEGVEFGPDGHLVDPAAWTEELGEKIAAASGIEMNDERWRVVRFVRQEFLAHGGSPNIRKITQGAVLSTRDFYTLFPKAPARTAARIAGCPKPVGCI